jgi:hypothetical protein
MKAQKLEEDDDEEERERQGRKPPSAALIGNDFVPSGRLTFGPERPKVSKNRSLKTCDRVSRAARQ